MDGQLKDAHANDRSEAWALLRALGDAEDVLRAVRVSSVRAALDARSAEDAAASAPAVSASYREALAALAGEQEAPLRGRAAFPEELQAVARLRTDAAWYSAVAAAAEMTDAA